MQHLHKKEYVCDDKDLSDVKLYSHVNNVAEYVHNLRRVRDK